MSEREAGVSHVSRVVSYAGHRVVHTVLWVAILLVTFVVGLVLAPVATRCTLANCSTCTE